MPMRGVKMSKEIIYLEADLIEVPEWARAIEREYLEESVEERGIIVPLIVAKIKNGNGRKNRYILIDGHGRLQLAKKKGEKYVPARLVDVKSEEEAILLAIELEQTKEPWSLGYTISVIQELLKRGYSKKKIAELLRIPRSKLYRILWLLELPEDVQKLFFDGTLPLRASETIKNVIDTCKEMGHEELIGEFIQELLKNPKAYETIANKYIDKARVVDIGMEELPEEAFKTTVAVSERLAEELKDVGEVKVVPLEEVAKRIEEAKEEKEEGQEEVEEVIVEEGQEEVEEEEEEGEVERLKPAEGWTYTDLGELSKAIGDRIEGSIVDDILVMTDSYLIIFRNLETQKRFAVRVDEAVFKAIILKGIRAAIEEVRAEE